ALMSLARWNLSRGDEKKADSLLQQADSIRKLVADPELTASVLFVDGTIKMTSNPKAALEAFKQAEEAVTKASNKRLYQFLLLGIEEIYSTSLSDYPSSMQYCLKLLQAAQETNDLYFKIIGWADIGSIYFSIGNQAEALRYFKMAEDANKKYGNKNLESSLQTSIGEGYRLSGKYPEAIEAYNLSIQLQNIPGNQYVNESNLADVYVRMNKLPLAFEFAFRSLTIAKPYNDIAAVSWIQNILSRAYLKKQMVDSALYYARSGFTLAKQAGTIEFMRDNVLALANAAAFKKDFENAFDYYKQYAAYKDSMTGAEVRNRTAVLQINNEIEKKELQISTLNQQKKSQETLLYSTLAVLVLIVIMVFVLLRNNRQRRKANNLLQQQKQEIDEKAKELSQQKDNLEKLEEIGHKITSSLSVENIISTVYANVNTLMDASVFGIGIYNDSLKRIEFPATYEKGKPLPFYTNSVEDKNRLAPVCFT
ncbi:MAG TPA: tetratricopeptide repeat protein, partial [Chitinophagaceae bacterium]|nr:tetratricopeptide repeat protein [Chitinophagaceae bacterium]